MEDKLIYQYGYKKGYQDALLEVESLSDALFFIRERDRLNRQTEEQTKREANTTSKPKPKIARFLPNESDKKCHTSDKKCQPFRVFNGLACGKPVENLQTLQNEALTRKSEK